MIHKRKLKNKHAVSKKQTFSDHFHFNLTQGIKKKENLLQCKKIKMSKQIRTNTEIMLNLLFGD
ncbi:MAG: hypothetical protein VW378_01595 [bacterium]